MLYSCCGSDSALPALASCYERRGAAGYGPGTTIKYLRRTTSGAAGNGLGATANYPRRKRAADAGDY